MKLKVLVRKKQLILAALVLVLGVAVYLNWELSDKNLGLFTEKDDKKYGETELTGATVTETSNDYFSKVRLKRQKERDSAIESVQTMLTDKNLTDSQKKEIGKKAAELTSIAKSESAIEELVKAKGFAECVAFIDGKTASVVVSSSGLTENQAAQIFDIVLSKTKINSENINIVEAK